MKVQNIGVLIAEPEDEIDIRVLDKGQDSGQVIRVIVNNQLLLTIESVMKQVEITEAK